MPLSGEPPVWARDLRTALPHVLWVIGTALAVTVSYTRHESMGWAVVHGLLNWVYVLFVAFFR